MNNTTDLKNELGRPVIKFIVLFGIVLVIKFIVLLLPMIAEITINKEAMPLAESINILFSTVLLAIWINFGFEIARAFDKTLPKIPEAGYMAKAFVFLVTFVAAYQIYMPFAKRHLNEKLWIYQLAFIVAAVFPIAAIARTLYQNVDNITNFILEKAQAGHGVIKYICTRCGAPAP
ncbi:MAG: hypothetical protein M1269_05145 [Chloroflexi bacterium]|nr:hypothetical protein [Chloroflexota bacterium]